MRENDLYETATSAEKFAALDLESKKAKISYGRLSWLLERGEWPRTEREIVREYIAQKQAARKERQRMCKGCAYRAKNAEKNGGCGCNFSQEGRVRRKDGAGNCLEYTREKKRKYGYIGMGQQPGTLIYRLTHEDWSGMTVDEIAVTLGTSKKSVQTMLLSVRKKMGKIVAYKRAKEEVEDDQ